MSPYLLYQAVRYRKYITSLKQRMGYLPVSFNLDGDSSIWIHAVSVGEVLAARALLPDLRERYPRLRIFLSTTTMTGQQIAAKNLQYVDQVFYFPFDLGFVVQRTLRLVRPRLFVMMETEIWPNLLRACHRAGVKTAFVNGRISRPIGATGSSVPFSAASAARRSAPCRATNRPPDRRPRRPRSACRSPFPEFD
jgi:3-deoxy-D-manno-octulosonic-acid transferase